MKFSNRKFDLEDRTAEFGKNSIIFSKSLHTDHVSKSIVSQFIRAATSIGANYMEANGASSQRDFTNKIYIAKKEVQETKHWLKMLLVCFPGRNDQIKILAREAQELTLIFQKILTTMKSKLKIKN